MEFADNLIKEGECLELIIFVCTCAILIITIHRESLASE